MNEQRKPKPRSKTPVSSFGPELLAALIKGAAEPLELQCPNSAIATKLVQRLYTLRKRMREENHPQSALVQRAKVSNQKGGRHLATIFIRPHDYEYRDIFSNAGIAVEQVRSNLLSSLTDEPVTDLSKNPLDTSRAGGHIGSPDTPLSSLLKGD